MTNLSILLTNTIATEINWNIETMKIVLPGLFSIAGIIAAALLTYRYHIRIKRKEIPVNLLQTKYNKKLEALEYCWKLLRYTTDTENSKSILVWEKVAGKKKQYYIQPHNAQEFLEQLPEMFYSSGYGLYLSKEIKEQLFTYRSNIYGIMLKEKDSKEEKITIQNTNLVEILLLVHNELNRLLRMETHTIEEKL